MSSCMESNKTLHDVLCFTGLMRTLQCYTLKSLSSSSSEKLSSSSSSSTSEPFLGFGRLSARKDTLFGPCFFACIPVLLGAPAADAPPFRAAPWLFLFACLTPTPVLPRLLTVLFI